MNSTSNIHNLLQEIAFKGAILEKPNNGDARRELLAAARSLCYKLETPIESLLRICWAEAQTHPAIRTGIEMNLFEKLVEDDGAAKSNSQLAAMTGADPVLLNWTLISNDAAGPPLRQLHKYLASTGFKNPTNPTDGPFQYGHNTPLHTFEWMKEHPLIYQQFGNFMAGYTQGRPSWLDFFPAEDRIVKGLSEKEEAVLLVDVGGGMGQDLEEFRRRMPSVKAELVLQDQEEFVERAKAGLAEKGIRAMAYDFFTPQPIKGARAYYLHSVLHNWPDSKCKDILSNLKPALAKGYSKLLINEVVIPNKGAPAVSTGLDLLLMAVSSSGHRTEKNWQELLDWAGFRLVKVWAFEAGMEGLIEAEVA
ncbi:hypothetical protein HO133_009267 [Letharia lupina]|uniref:O-methyltransferase C-terminal domain-containing protein n=1 Tax=Letharia lupina TaxID=560253 RepID=A0A8H6FFN9_9LECA|nr:uncharacterized protein HO133_009267 [Letharia lupina]KAF6226401.1 hypothetical protein HO133_009267 [Letharia lupina]